MKFIYKKIEIWTLLSIDGQKNKENLQQIYFKDFGYLTKKIRNIFYYEFMNPFNQTIV